MTENNPLTIGELIYKLKSYDQSLEIYFCGARDESTMIRFWDVLQNDSPGLIVVQGQEEIHPSHLKPDRKYPILRIA
jgi:hypothetical protein